MKEWKCMPPEDNPVVPYIYLALVTMTRSEKDGLETECHT